MLAVCDTIHLPMQTQLASGSPDAEIMVIKVDVRLQLGLTVRPEYIREVVAVM